MEQDFNRRMVTVARKDIEPWQIMNTVAHCAAHLGNKLKDGFDSGEHFFTKDKVPHPRNSQYPIIVLSAKSAQELADLLAQIRKENAMHIAFMRENIDFEDDVELNASLGNKEAKDVEYLGIGIFGENALLKTLTKKFALWK